VLDKAAGVLDVGEQLSALLDRRDEDRHRKLRDQLLDVHREAGAYA
jgi:hypothetical protein